MLLGIYVVSELIQYCQLGNYFQFCRGCQENLLLQSQIKGQYMNQRCCKEILCFKVHRVSVRLGTIAGRGFRFKVADTGASF